MVFTIIWVVISILVLISLDVVAGHAKAQRRANAKREALGIETEVISY